MRYSTCISCLLLPLLLSKAKTGEILGEFAGREEAIQEARKVAQREPATLIRLETENGTSEAVPLLGKDPATEVA